MPLESITVTGASSQIGFFLLPLLATAGYQVVAVSRNASYARAAPPEIRCHIADLTSDVEGLIFSSYLIHLAPIWTLPPLIARASAQGLARLIAFSSTSAISKRDSPNLAERQLALSLQQGELEVRKLCEKFNIKWTIFRPTMIYGCGRDANVTAIARFIDRLGFFPIAVPGLGLRQPVHAEDLARAVCDALLQSATYSQIYNLSGGEVLTYRTMVEKIFIALNKTPRLVFLPPLVFKSVVRLAKSLGRFRHLTGQTVDRMNQDLSFSHDEATRDFWFNPRRFEFHYPLSSESLR